MTKRYILELMVEIYKAAWQLKYDRSVLIVKLNTDGDFSEIDPQDAYGQELFQYLNGLPKVNAKAGYKVKFIAQHTVDLLILGEEVLNERRPDFTTILLHELAHCVIDSGDRQYITIDQEAKVLGDKMYTMLNPATEDDTRHSEDFCRVLAQGAIGLNSAWSTPERSFFTSNEDGLRSALRYEQIWE